MYSIAYSFAFNKPRCLSQSWREELGLETIIFEALQRYKDEAGLDPKHRKAVESEASELNLTQEIAFHPTSNPVNPAVYSIYSSIYRGQTH